MTHMYKLGLVGLAVLALPTLGRAQLLTEGGFENPNLLNLAAACCPFVPGVWGFEVSARDTGPTQGVTPLAGAWMLKMDNAGLVATQTMQFVYIGDRGILNTLDVAAWYNADVPAADVRLIVQYYANDTDFGSSLSIDVGAMILDVDTSTWEELSFSSTIPPAANWVEVQVAFRNDSIGTKAGFVDEVSLHFAPFLVDIDIKPGSFPNSINLGSRGTVPVAIFSTLTFDATEIDPGTVTLAGASVRLRGKGVPQAALEDVNGDGLLDLVVHIVVEELQISAGDVEAILEGELFDGTPIQGSDSVRIPPQS